MESAKVTLKGSHRSDGCRFFTPQLVIMSISHLSLVNQKLAYAAASINLLKKLESRQSLEWQALSDAVIFHLSTALHFYLRELAEHHRIYNLSSIDSVQRLAAELQGSDKMSSESSELIALAQTNGTWLNQLTAYHNKLFESPHKPKEPKSFGRDNLIELVELVEVDTPPSLILTPELLTSWLDSFRALVIRQRETNAEY